MNDEEVQGFEDEPYFRQAVMLRRWDEQAKDPQAETPPLEHFRRHLQAAIDRSAGDV